LRSVDGSFRFTVDPPQEKELWLKNLKEAVDNAKDEMLNNALGGGNASSSKAEGSKKFKQIEEEKIKKKRNDTVKQIFDSEKEYLATLNYVKNTFLNPMRELPCVVVAPKELADIFLNLEELCDLHASLLEAIERRIETWTDESEIGDIFLDRNEQISNDYFEFVRGHTHSKQTLEICLTHSSFAMFLMELESREKKQLAELLSLPLRQFSKYYLLLQELLQYTPGHHPDYTELKKIVEQLKKKNEEMEQEKMNHLRQAKSNPIILTFKKIWFYCWKS